MALRVGLDADRAIAGQNHLRAGGVIGDDGAATQVDGGDIAGGLDPSWHQAGREGVAGVAVDGGQDFAGAVVAGDMDLIADEIRQQGCGIVGAEAGGEAGQVKGQRGVEQVKQDQRGDGHGPAGARAELGQQLRCESGVHQRRPFVSWRRITSETWSMATMVRNSRKKIATT